MKIIISPAKKMVEDTDSFDISKLPIFKDKAEVLLTWLKSKNYDGNVMIKLPNLTMIEFKI